MSIFITNLAFFGQPEFVTSSKMAICLEDALRGHVRAEMFNSDQNVQFTSHTFPEVLQRERVMISMAGRGQALVNIFVERWSRSVKHEDVYLIWDDGRADDCAGAVLRVLQR